MTDLENYYKLAMKCLIVSKVTMCVYVAAVSIIMFAALSFLSSVFFGCGVSAPRCQTAGEYRCNANMVEMCDGKAWNERYQCEECGTDGEVAWCE